MFMKRILFSFLTLLSIQALAQTEKGTTLVGGSLNLQTTSNNSTFSINPNLGFFPANNFAIGANVVLNFSKLDSLKTNTIGLGPYVRYYFGKTQTKPFVTTEVNFLHRSIKNTAVASKLDEKSNGVGFLLGLGFAAFVNDMVAVEGLTGYNYSKFNASPGSSGFAMRFGFQLYFNRQSYSDLKTNVLGQ